jgi:hypothetical protein
MSATAAHSCNVRYVELSSNPAPRVRVEFTERFVRLYQYWLGRQHHSLAGNRPELALRAPESMRPMTGDDVRMFDAALLRSVVIVDEGDSA